MDFKTLVDRAMALRKTFAKYEEFKFGKKWTKAQMAEGLVGDVGDLMKLVLAKDGVRDIEEVDKKLAHELSDCLWSIIVLAHEYNVDLEKAYMESMDEIEQWVKLKME